MAICTGLYRFAGRQGDRTRGSSLGYDTPVSTCTSRKMVTAGLTRARQAKKKKKNVSGKAGPRDF